jgi:hypothetical protein
MSNANTAERRKRYFVDAKVQGALLRQAIWYWLWSSALFALLIVVYRVAPAWLSGQEQGWSRLWYHIAPYLLASAALFPLIVAKANRFSNRFVGPMVRIRKTLKQLANGEIPEPIELRDKDYYRELAADINLIAVRLAHAPPAARAEFSTVEAADSKPVPVACGE